MLTTPPSARSRDSLQVSTGATHHSTVPAATPRACERAQLLPSLLEGASGAVLPAMLFSHCVLFTHSRSVLKAALTAAQLVAACSQLHPSHVHHPWLPASVALPCRAMEGPSAQDTAQLQDVLRDPSWRASVEDLETGTQGLVLAAIDKQVCSRSKAFLGKRFSSFTGDIFNMRSANGLRSVDDASCG